MPLPNSWFRDLTPAEEEQFREYSRTHDPDGWDQWCVCHPVCRDEWTKLGKAVEPPKEEL